MNNPQLENKIQHHAIAFAEWIVDNGWYRRYDWVAGPTKEWYTTKPYSGLMRTLPELYNMFKKDCKE
jgi:hypothetical protein